MSKGNGDGEIKNVGEVSPRPRSMVDGLPLIALDGINDCQGDECPVLDQCSYKKYGKCGLRRRYIEHVIKSYITSIDRLDSLDLQRIGSLLVPLWDQLCRLKMEEVAILKVFDGKGINPVLKNIREVIKTIIHVEKTCKLDRKGEKVDPMDLSQFGDPDYYESLEKREMAEDEI